MSVLRRGYRASGVPMETPLFHIEEGQGSRSAVTDESKDRGRLRAWESRRSGRAICRPEVKLGGQAISSPKVSSEAPAMDLDPACSLSLRIL
ncbi:hypothetical protein SKAU_G00108270 [Synaphobranchus kaupii]|uniref:Uncharacterized protein n=1 Tax=Synaphobranchus kaupii TaxID=118154 RepID=A0A9Q1G0L5_SYNKA|nr:hypothetical protein SKAU_G00108270 [Synaphobranchus kaupii]